MFTAYLKIGSRAFSPGKVKSFFYPLVYWVTMRTRTPMLATLFLYTRRRQYMSLHHQDIVLSISPLRIRYRASLVQINLVLLNYLIMNFIHCIGTRTKNWNNVVKMFLKQNLFYKNRPIHFFSSRKCLFFVIHSFYAAVSNAKSIWLWLLCLYMISRSNWCYLPAFPSISGKEI